MKKSVLLLATLAFSMAFTSAEAQNRGRQNTGTNTTLNKSAATKTVSGNNVKASTIGSTASRPGTPSVTPRPSTPATPSMPNRPGSNAGATRPGSSTPSTGATQRPGNGSVTTPPGNGSTTQRPGNGNATQRPGNGNVTQRPGTSMPNTGASQRPGTPNVRPSTPPTPPPPSRPNYPPPPPRPNGYQPGYSYRPPMPHTPPGYTYYRPTPPPSWHVSSRSPNFGTILGVALGTFFSNSINALFNSGYNVSGYTNNEVYLSNVNYCNLNWPNVTMYYNNGYLAGSLFSASSISYDPSRYNYVYNTLCSQYGYPVSSQSLSGGGMSCTWWGVGNSYITLSFYPEYISGLGTRYFTTVATGN